MMRSRFVQCLFAAGLAVGLVVAEGMEAQEPGPQFELLVQKQEGDDPCGTTVMGDPDALFDDGMGGADFFFDPVVFQNTFEEVPNNRPGETFDVVLRTTENPTIGSIITIDCTEPGANCNAADCDNPDIECTFDPNTNELLEQRVPGDKGAQGWSWSLGSEGALAITDVTTNGSRSCVGGRFPRGPTCLQVGGFEVSELTGPDLMLPDGTTVNRAGPDTVDGMDNSGAVSAIVLSQRLPITLPPDEENSTIAKVRILGTFPDAGSAPGRLFWAERQGQGQKVPNIVTFEGRTFNEKSNPPLKLTECQITLQVGDGMEICDNGMDDDGDGDVDCDDADCAGDPACVEDCDNGMDDDGDGDVDCADADCTGDPACVEDCENEMDDDGDGLVDCDDVEDCPPGQGMCPGIECPDWAFYFGAAATTDQVDATGATSLAISSRNATDAFAFQLGVSLAAAGNDQTYTFSGDLGADENRLIELIITDELGNSQTPATPNTALAPAPVSVVRGSVIEPFQADDFFAVDMDPGVGGPGFTVGYVTDLEGDRNKIPVTADDPACPLNEIVVVNFEAVAGSFRRGDADGNARINVTDAVLVIQVTLGNLPERFTCDDALDSNDDGAANISDAIPILMYLFQAGPPLPDPFLACGQDPTDDGLDCPQDSPACVMP